MTFAFALVLPLGFNACPDHNSRPGAAPPAAPAAAATAQTAPASARPAFDGQRAFEHVRRMVETGPRPAGSAALAKTRQYIVGELQSAGLAVTTDEFEARTPVGKRRMANVVAELPGESPEIVIIASHYDTKLYKEFRFVGANDGGSSTGVLIELARSLASAGKPRLTYRFVFFDGEEAFCKSWDECTTPDGPDNTYGSRHYVEKLKAAGEKDRVKAMILLDMVGYTNLRLARDDMGTAWLADIVWETGRQLGYGAQFVEGLEGVGGDDHVPFLRAGVSAIDIIQLNSYPHWHTPQDTLDKISPRSLQIVGETVLASLPRVEQRILKK